MIVICKQTHIDNQIELKNKNGDILVAYFSNLEKQMNNEEKKPKIARPKLVAIILTLIATVGYFSLFTNLVGFLKHFLLGTFGIFAYALFTSLYLISGMLLKGKKYNISKKYLFALIFALFSILAIFHMAFSGGIDVSKLSYGQYLSEIYKYQVSVGGLLMSLIVYPFQRFLNFGAYIAFAIVLVVCVTIIYNGIADAKSMSKIDFKWFKKKDKYKTNAPIQKNKDEEQKNNYSTITIETNQNDLQNQKTESVGLNAQIEQEQLSPRERARRKLGLDKLENGNNQGISSASQLKTFEKNYMNIGGSVFTEKTYPSDISNTFGYNAGEYEKPQTPKIDVDKTNEYRKFMGLSPITKQELEEPKQEYSNNQNIYQNNIYSTAYTDSFYKHDNTETNDEKLFGAPKTQENSTNIKFTYSSPEEKSDYLDKISNEKNEEQKLDVEVEEQKENNLSEIFDNNLPNKDIELPKSFQNDNYAIKKFDLSISIYILLTL